MVGRGGDPPGANIHTTIGESGFEGFGIKVLVAVVSHNHNKYGLVELRLLILQHVSHSMAIF